MKTFIERLKYLIYQLYVLQIRDYESYRVDATMQ